MDAPTRGLRSDLLSAKKTRSSCHLIGSANIDFRAPEKHGHLIGKGRPRTADEKRPIGAAKAVQRTKANGLNRKSTVTVNSACRRCQGWTAHLLRPRADLFPAGKRSAPPEVSDGAFHHVSGGPGRIRSPADSGRRESFMNGTHTHAHATRASPDRSIRAAGARKGAAGVPPPMPPDRGALLYGPSPTRPRNARKTSSPGPAWARPTR